MSMKKIEVPKAHLKAVEGMYYRIMWDFNVLKEQLSDPSVTLEPWDGSSGGCILS